MKSIVTREIAVQAIEIVRPTILGAAEFLARVAMHIVVVDPTQTFVYWQSRVENDEQLWGAFQRSILHEESVGMNPAEWPRPYGNFARQKAFLSWRTGYDSRAIQQLYPHLYADEDIKYGGSVCLDGLVIGASGAQSHFDQMYAGMTGLGIKAIVMGKVEEILADKTRTNI